MRQSISSDPGDEQTHIYHPLTEEESFNLNTDQQAAHDILMAYILTPAHECESRAYLLVGPAGTGKTTTINRLVENIRKNHPGINFGMTAPTHKAVGNLKRHSELKNQLDFGTIHSFLGLKEKQVQNPLKKNEMMIVYEPDFNSRFGRRIDEIDVLIVDESSMLGDVLYGHIEDAWRSKKSLKIIYMGDERQIPPVKEKGVKVTNPNAIPFIPEQRSSRKIGYLVLSEIVRQARGNPIIAYATDIRLQYKNQSIIHTYACTEEDRGIELLQRDIGQLRSVLKRYFGTDKFASDPDYCKVIAWRNETVDFVNKEVRSIIHKQENLPRIVVGDRLVMDKPFLKGEKIILANNEEVYVKSVESGKVTVKYKMIERGSAFESTQNDLFSTADEIGVKIYSEEFKVYRTTVVAEDKEVVLDILHEDELIRFKDLKKTVETCAKKQSDTFDKKEMWRIFFGLDKHFAQIKYNYCLTAHKAQGSTYDYVISMEWDIDQNWDIQERNRIRYVAATRARYKLYIIK